MSKLKRFNLLFQFTGFRLCRVVEKDHPLVAQQWGLIGPVIPGTGWGSDYVGWPALRITWRCP